MMKSIDKTDVIVGIDLGTTNSSVAVVNDSGIEVIPVHGNPSMPSAVGVAPSGKLIIGRAAKNQAASAPENTILSIKRLMGTEQTVELAGKSYRPEEISALILRELKQAAEQHLGHPVRRAVITVPAFFNERQRQATQDAGQLAELEVVRIINEPTAAALAYGAGAVPEENMPAKSETLLVYDLGGGTFDVSLVAVENGVVEVRASHGDTHLGGDDFDAALAELAEARFRESRSDTEPALPEPARRRLKSAMERAKITLSDAPFTRVEEEFLTESAHLTTEFSRGEYEDLIAGHIEKTLECLQRALTDANIPASSVDKILLVGGATRTPLVQLVIESRLNVVPRHEIDPDLIVAMGAAIQGAALSGRPAPAILVDITAHSYGVSALVDGPAGFLPLKACVPIIRRGTALPARKSEVFVTYFDNQTMVNVEVFQGESLRPEENLQIGSFQIEGLAKVPSGNQVVVGYQIDLNGLIHVTATEKSTGLVKSVTIDTGGHHRINLDAARTNLAALFEEDDMQEDEDFAMLDSNVEVSHAAKATNPAELLASAKSLRRRADSILAAGIAQSDEAEIRTLLETSSAAIAKQDWPTLKDADDKLSDLLFYLED
jgi:molecular chaperone DnaK